VVMSRDQNAGRSHSVKTDNRSFVRMEDFKCLGKILTKQSSIQRENKRRLNSGNACCYSVQNVLSSGLLSENINNKIYRACCFVWV
jgi:hypothetical protein